MNINKYQQLAARTLNGSMPELTSDEMSLIWNAIGLAGEAGEVAELAKKGVFHQHGVDVATFKNELGDVLWYVVALCTRLGLDMSEVMQHNIDKLNIRYPDGYSSEDSKRRADIT